MRRIVTTTLSLAAALAVLGCGRSGPPPVRAGSGAGPRFTVLAAENFWGSLAAQLAGSRARVSSVIADPATDPHSYEPTSADARRLAGANMVILNGAGYDNWAGRLLSASPSATRVVLDVGKQVGAGAGANPHLWYYPRFVHQAIVAIAAGYRRLDPADGSYFAARERALETSGLARYEQLLGEIRRRYAGTPVGYSESIFQGMGEALGLRLLTPIGFARAVAEGTDVTAADKRAVDAQAQGRKIRVWVFNSQNLTPDVQRVNELARSRGIALVRVSETLEPASASFEQWQDGQLEALLRALGAGR